MGSFLMCKAIRAILYVLRRTESEAHHTFISSTKFKVGWGSVVVIATGYGLDGPGIESRWGARFFALVQTGPGAHPSSCTVGTGSFPE